MCETFTAVPLAWQAEFDITRTCSIHGPGASRWAIGPERPAPGWMTTMRNALEDTGGRYGLQVMGVAGGLATVFIVERL